MPSKRPLLLSAFLALLAMMFDGLHAQSAIDAWKKALGLDTPVRVVVAGRDLRAGQTLSKTDLKVDSLPASYFHEGMVELKTAEEERALPVVGMKLRRDLTTGHLLLYADVDQGDSPAAGVPIPSDKSALALPIDASTAAGGHITPGDRVDIIGSFQGGRRIVALVRAALVVASGEQVGGTDLLTAGGNDPGNRTLTVAVDDAQTEMLLYALSHGTLTCVLRSATSQNNDTITLARLQNLLMPRRMRVHHII